MSDDYIFEKMPERLPVMALRGISVFPDMVMSFEVERPMSIAAVNAASKSGRRIFLTAQRDVLCENPGEGDIYKTGTVAVVRQFIKTQNGTIRVMVEGKFRARFARLSVKDNCWFADVYELVPPRIKELTSGTDALIRQVLGLYERFSALSGNTLPETLISLSLKDDPGYIADFITQNVYLKYTEKQQVLETLDPVRRLQVVSSILAREVEVLAIEQTINEKLHQQLVKVQRDNILREQMKVIQTELGDDEASELDTYREKIHALGLRDEDKEKLLKDCDRLAKQPFGSAEGSLLRAYLDVCLELPWNKSTKERINIAQAKKLLDREHFGLEKVKERIIEHLAAKQLAPDVKGTILCLVGPPGVGKTSIAISIAKSVNRKLARMSLGGVHDEAEIRGHRKTYIGAMPGRIISAVNQSGSKNPLLLLDEIDKLGSDFRGDPASALLEALDPEQNTQFRDHYLEIPFDLSDVMFITTANTTDTIPRPLLDRMEVIELSSYTDEEKLMIAKRHLIPKQKKKHGLTGKLRMGDDVIREIIAGWTRESGVRTLEREIGAVCRRAAAAIVSGETSAVTVRTSDIEKYLGVRKFKQDKLAHTDSVGLVKGLAWTSVGGEILEAEAIALDGSGKLELTGNLGDVMKESAHAAVSYIRSRAHKLGIECDFYKTKDIHIHFPEGAIPKDGPSAGITMAIAVISALTGIPVRRNVAMTGEITLTGRILPIGGLKEKTMAALRAGVKTVIIPSENERDLEEIDQTVRRALNFVTASHLDDILDTALVMPHTDMPADIALPAQRTGVADTAVQIRQ